MDCIDQITSENDSSLQTLHQDDFSDSDEEEKSLRASSSHDLGPGIDFDSIRSAKKVEHTLVHSVQAGRSILALVADDDYLFAGLEGGEITVSGRFYCPRREQILRILNQIALTLGSTQVWSLETFEKVFTVHAHVESVLSLYLSEDKQLLFSSGVDSVVNVKLPISCPLLMLKNAGLVSSKLRATLLDPFAS